MLASGARLGTFEILGPLGAGGMGEVYRARDPRLGREVAIKVVPAERLSDPTRRARFVQEAKAASALNHPHIVTIHEIDSADGIDFIVMELVAGKTLDALIPRQGMRFREALRVAIPIADALAAAHARGIVHRDLKPANVIVTGAGVVKVLDFGLAKLVAAEVGEDDETLPTAVPLTQQGAIQGTAPYMSPEQATGGSVDARSDIFSFGAVLYEMVTGRRAFAGKTVSETLTAVVRSEPMAPRQLVPEIPEPLERLIQRCLRKDRDRRVQHMLDVEVELQELLDDSSSRPAPQSPALHRHGALLILAGLACALAMTAGILHMRSRRTDASPPATVPLTSTAGAERRPTFSPNGNQVAFQWDGERRDNTDVYVKMIGATQTHRLTIDPAVDGSPSWSPDGRQIAFVRASGENQGTIHLISPLGGPDRKLSDEFVARYPPSWSPDGRWLATYADSPAINTRSGVPRGIRLIDASSGEARSITIPGGSAFHSQPAFSPDGHHLAYLSCPLSYSCYIDVIGLGADLAPTGPERRLTRTVIWANGLAWTRDGKSVVYGDGISGRLWRVGIAGDAQPERLEVAGFGAGDPVIAAASDRLAFARSGNSPAIYRYVADGRPEAVAASTFGDWNPHISPDGRRFAFESRRGGEGDEIWLASADGTNPIQLTHGPGLWQGSPRWSPDGRRIAFDSLAQDGQWDVWTMDAEGGSLRRLTSDPADDTQPTWSNDGRFVYFSSNRSGTEAIWRISATSGSEEQVTREGGGRAQETPDGRTLLFQRISLAGSPLLAVPLAGGPERTLIDCVPRYGYAAVTVGIYHVACGGDASAASLFLLDPATGRDQVLGKVELFGVGLTASTDGKTILFTARRGEGSDLVLIENFR